MAGFKRRLTFVFLVLWLVWFSVTAILGRTHVIYDIYERGKLAWSSTTALFQGVGRFLYYWTNFTAPFLIDVWRIVTSINENLNWKTRAMLVAIGSTLLGVYLIVRQFFIHRENVLRVAFNWSILFVAPLTWALLSIIPNPKVWEPTAVLLLTSIIPCVQSVRAFWARNKKECGRWLRYWVIFPVLETSRDMIMAYAAESEGGAEILKLLFIFTMWLQIWDGSLAFHQLCGYLGKWGLGVLPLKISRKDLFPTWRPTEGINIIKRAMIICTENIMATSILAVLVIVPLILFFKFLSKVVPILIMWGASVNCAEVVLKQIEQLYEQKIAFWILMQASTLSLLKVPVVGTLFEWLRIPTLVCFYMFGHPILTILGNSCGMMSSNHGVAKSPIEEAKRRHHGHTKSFEGNSKSSEVDAVSSALAGSPGAKYGAHRRDVLGSPDSENNVGSRIP